MIKLRVLFFCVISNRDQDDEDDEEEEYGSDEGGERRDKKDTPQGPWNKVGATQSDEPAETAAPAPAPGNSPANIIL